MKIIHTVLGKANPERMNGVNKVAYQLAKTQYEMGLDVCIWGIANTLEHDYPSRDFPTVLFQQIPNKLQLDANLIDAVQRKVTEHTVFHLHGAFIPEFYLLSKLLRRRGIDYIYTPHGSLTPGAMKQRKWKKKIYFSLFERNLIYGAKAVQLLGEQGFNFIDQLMEVPQKVLIPNGMDLNEIPALPEKEQLPFPIFNFCGRMDIYHKGLDLMLRGFQQFLAAGHSGRLELIGEGKDREKVEAMASSLGIAEHVVFHGSKFGDEKYQFMNRGDVFLHTSRNEGFPMAVLEAAALGLPCLTSEQTSINGFIRKYEAGFPLRDKPTPRTIYEALEAGAKAFMEGRLPERGENAKRMVKEVFDWRQICHQLNEVYGTEAKEPI